MAYLVPMERRLTLADYQSHATLVPAVDALRGEAASLAPRLRGRTVWMLNSTARGGGVAEMLPALVSLLCELGVEARWAVMESGDPGFFPLTKRLHNLMHGDGDPALGADDRERYDAVSRANAVALEARIRPGDVVVVHDPQPLGVGALLGGRGDVHRIWRCHVGVDFANAATRAAWDFLEPYLSGFERAVFSAEEYIPPFLVDRATIIHPGLDPLSHKNRELSLHKHVGVLCDAALSQPHGPVLAPPFDDPAERLQADGSWVRATFPEDLGLLYRPVVTQISRWDRLKGFLPLLEAFRRLKLDNHERERRRGSRHARAVDFARLVLAGPAPGAVADDPEAADVLEELCGRYLSLEPGLRQDIAVLRLPMRSAKQNALMVNALQRASDVVVQNSLREGFGLTATEAMWKGIPVVGTQAVGLRQQIRDGVDGLLVSSATAVDELADAIDRTLADPVAAEVRGRSARQRVYQHFLVFAQLRHWLQVLAGVADGG